MAKDVAAGTLRVRLETLDDLWALHNLVAVGDLVEAPTYRTVEIPTDKVRAEKAEKKPMTLGVRVEKVEWHGFDDHLRVHGTIVTGPQDHGRHHTLVLRDDGAVVAIGKRGPLRSWHLDLVAEAERNSRRPRVLLCAIDDAEAQFAVLRGHGVQWLGSIPAGSQGKQFATGDAKTRYYDEVAKALAIHREQAGAGKGPEGAAPMVIVGPGFWREEFLAHARERHAAAVAGALTDGTSQGGRAGIQEALHRGQVERVARDHRVHEDMRRVEAVFAGLARPDGLVAVGPQEVASAVDAGAVEEVLVTDAVVREGKLDDVLHAAERTRAVLHVVSSAHEAGARLGQLGGVAAMLRFRPG